MKKKISCLMFTLTIILSTLITAFAEADAPASADKFFDFNNIFECFKASPSAITVAVISFVAVLFFVVFRKKLGNRLNNTSASSMINAFIGFFSVSGIACLALSFATEGETWSNLMNSAEPENGFYSQFEDYILGIKSTGTLQFHKTAAANTPLAHLIYFILAQFLPTKLIYSESILEYSKIFKNQQFMFLYLLLILFIIVIIYRLCRVVIRNNQLNIRNEVVLFLMAVSFPMVYSIEKGNIPIFISLCLVMAFMMLRNHNKPVIKELSYISLAAASAIAPFTIVFALLLLEEKTKKCISSFTRTIIYFVVIFIAPSVFTGPENLATYLKAFFSVSAEGYIPGNMSIANLLHFFGINNTVITYAVVILTQVVAVIALLTLESAWQKTAAAVYIILNIFAVSDAIAILFVFIPLFLLFAEKTHKATNWLYLLSFALLVTPIPEWFRFDENFNMFMESMNISSIINANNLITLAAAQFILIILFCQTIALMKDKKVKKQAEIAEKSANS